jgi:hypothetical protein
MGLLQRSRGGRAQHTHIWAKAPDFDWLQRSCGGTARKLQRQQPERYASGITSTSRGDHAAHTYLRSMR